MVPRHSLGENLMFDPDTCLIVTMLQEVFHVGSVEPNPKKYVKKYKQQIKEAGKVLEYLGLAQQSKKSVIGWRPTSLFMEILAERVSKRQAIRGYGEEEMMIDLLFDAVFGNKNYTGRTTGLCLLNALGLARATFGGGWAATRHLHSLIADGYYSQKYSDAVASGKA
jgi:hypothetical protein